MLCRRYVWMMAETVAKPKVEWKKSTKMDSSDDSDSYVPGVNNVGNLRPKLHARRTHEAKSKTTAKQSSEEQLQSSTSLSMQELSQSLDERKLHSTASKQSKVSLKDLCVEDKRRIANLIKELARVGEEREKAREELEKERKQYEQQLLELVHQQEVILKERQEVEKQLIDCQNLLMQCQVQRASLPPASLPQITQSQGIHDSIFTSIKQRPVTAMIDKEIAIQRHSSIHPQALGNGTCPQSNFVHTTLPGPLLPHQGHNYKSPAACDLQPQQLSVVYPSFPAEYSQLETQAPHLYNAFLTHGEEFQANLNTFASRGNKEDIMKRFLASQLPEKDIKSPAACELSAKGKKYSKCSRKFTPLLPPRMSSTQKSAEIGEFLSVNTSESHHDFPPLAPDDSPESSAQGDGGDIVKGGPETDHKVDQNYRDQGKVMFTEAQEETERRHTPLDDRGENRGNVHAYRQLTQLDRRQQLLEQRAQLLEEQKRLKQILSEQEAMLKEKQQALYLRANNGANYGSDRDPQGLVPQRIALDTALERQRAVLESLEARSKQHASPRCLDSSGQNQENLKEKTTHSKKVALHHGQTADNHGSTFIVHPTKLTDIAKKLDYSLLSDQEVVGQSVPHYTVQSEVSSSEDEDGEDGSETGVDNQDNVNDNSALSKKVDAGTSVSYHHILRPAITPPEKVCHTADWEGHSLNATHPVPSHRSCTPGEKTMTVLEIINSQAEGSPLNHQTHRFSSIRGQSHVLHRHWTHQETSLFKQNKELPVSSRRESGNVDTEDNSSNDDAEESQILEDIFFVK